MAPPTDRAPRQGGRSVGLQGVARTPGRSLPARPGVCGPCPASTRRGAEAANFVCSHEAVDVVWDRIFSPRGAEAVEGCAGGFSSAMNACTRRGTAKNFARRLATPPCGMIVPAASCSAKSMVTRQEKKGASLLSPSYSPQSPQTQSTPEEQLQHKRPVCGRDRSRDRAAASSRDVAATAAARDRTGKRNEATAGPDAGLRAAEPPAREAGLLQRGWTFIIEAFIEPPQTYAGVL